MAHTELPVVELDGQTLTIDGVVAIARGRAQARITPGARERNRAAERLVRDLLDRGELLYGTSTGVGSLRAEASSSRTRAITSGGWCAATRAAAAPR